MCFTDDRPGMGGRTIEKGLPTGFAPNPNVHHTTVGRRPDASSIFFSPAFHGFNVNHETHQIHKSILNHVTAGMAIFERGAVAAAIRHQNTIPIFLRMRNGLCLRSSVRLGRNPRLNRADFPPLP